MATIDLLLDKVEWELYDPPQEDNPEGLPYVVRTGKLEIGGITLDCAVLSNGVRILTEESIMRAFGITED